MMQMTSASSVEAAAAAAVVAQPQRIEVDEGAVHAARSSARKQGLVVGLLLAVIVGGIAWVGGTASQQGADRAKSAKDAHDLAGALFERLRPLISVEICLGEAWGNQVDLDPG